VPIDFEVLLPQIDRLLNKIGREAQKCQALILTEDDLKCILFSELRKLSTLRGRFSTQNAHILGSTVHSEVFWYGESQDNRRGRLSY
jgi:hypothetical protein